MHLKKNSSSGYCENLQGQLQSKAHKSTLETDQDKSDCEEAIKFLDGDVAVGIDHCDSGILRDLKKDVEIIQKPAFKFQEKDLNNLDFQKKKSKDEIALKFDIVSFVITNNLPFSIRPKLLAFIQKVNNTFDFHMLSQAKINDHRIHEIVVDCMGAELEQRNLDYLLNSPFSISIDEGSDKMGEGFLALSARCFTSPSKNHPEERFLALLEIGTSSTSQSLYNKTVNLLFSGTDQDLIKRNFMGICSDHASNMISEGEAGLQERLKTDFFIYL